MARARAAVVMAAGQGTRMRSALAKVLHPVAGRPMIHYAVREALALGCAPVVVIVGHQREAVEARLAADFPGAPVVTAVQAEQRGTAHAVACAGPALAGFAGDVFILSGDVPGLPAATLAELDAAGGRRRGGGAGDEAGRSGGLRAARPGPGGELLSIVEYKDSTPAQKAIDEVNAGVYRVHADFLFDALGRVGSDNAQGEFYLTDIIGLSVEAGAARARWCWRATARWRPPGSMIVPIWPPPRGGCRAACRRGCWLRA
ncbi:MAG: NTP transferase domain-containing protein [bacterium]